MKDCCVPSCKKIAKYICQGMQGRKLYACEAHLADAIEDLTGIEFMVTKIEII